MNAKYKDLINNTKGTKLDAYILKNGTIYDG
jgi:hypothetical protein